IEGQCGGGRRDLVGRRRGEAGGRRAVDGVAGDGEVVTRRAPRQRGRSDPARGGEVRRGGRRGRILIAGGQVHHRRDGRHALLVHDEQRVVAGRREGRVAGRLHRQASRT